MISHQQTAISKQPSQGFTLIEVLVVMGILSILSTIGYLVTVDFYKSYAFNAERDTVVSILEKTRADSLANINQASHGVYFDPVQNKYVIFQGGSFALRNPSFDQLVPYASGINRGGLTEFVFSQLSGDLILPGNVTLSDGKRNSVISLNSEGQINW